MSWLDKDSFVIFCSDCNKLLLWVDGKDVLYPVRKGETNGMQSEKRQKRKKVSNYNFKKGD